jgi:hypothetical protein
MGFSPCGDLSAFAPSRGKEENEKQTQSNPDIRCPASSIQHLTYLTTPRNLRVLPAPWGSGLGGKSTMQNKANVKMSRIA